MFPGGCDVTTYNFSDLLRLVAATVPDNVALVQGEQQLTYADLDGLTDKFAIAFADAGLSPGDNVGLQLLNSPNYVAAFFGACRVGAVPFNVNYRYSASELAYLYSNAQAKALIFGTEFQQTVADACGHGYRPEVMFESGGNKLGVHLESVLASISGRFDAPRDDLEQIIIYTGGTTGDPKGVMWPHKHLFFSALGGGGYFHADGAISRPEELAGRVRDGMVLTTMPLAPLMHGAALWTTLIALFAGHRVILADTAGFDADRSWQLIREHGVNIVSIVGDAMALPLIEVLEENRKGRDSDWWPLDHLFNVGSGGAVFSESLQGRFTELLPNLIVTSSLGTTETGTVGTGDAEAVEGIMRYTPRDDLVVLVDGRFAERGEEGILARSGMVPVGYFGDEEKTRETFVTIGGVSYALAGDAARREDDDSITVLGRGSMCINTGGEKVFPEEVESALKGHPTIDDVLVVGVPHPKWGQQVAAVYSAGEREVDESSLASFCRETLAGYKVPRLFCRVARVERTVVGKPDYGWARTVAMAAIGN